MAAPLREGIDVGARHRPNRNGRDAKFVHTDMRLAIGLLTFFAFGCSLCVPAGAQPAGCADTLVVDSTTVCISFLAAAPAGNVVTVHESFSGGGRTVAHDVTFDLVPGARASRMIDDVDISAIVPGRRLHNTLKYVACRVTLERALLLPGAIPLR